jgi:hypothetical protein
VFAVERFQHFSNFIGAFLASTKSDKLANDSTKPNSSDDKVFINSVDDALDKIQGNGVFNWCYALPLGVGYAFGMTYLIPFMIQMPQLQCTYDDGNNWESCVRKDV